MYAVAANLNMCSVSQLHLTLFHINNQEALYINFNAQTYSACHRNVQLPNLCILWLPT